MNTILDAPTAKKRLAWISTERHSPNSQTAASQSAESLTCRIR
jgi:hypothetical protein